MENEDDKITEFEKHLKFYMWDPVSDASAIREMNQTEKFKGKHNMAAATFLLWMKNGYPKVNQGNKEAQRWQHLTNLYKIFRMSCPEHDIFKFIDE